MPWAIAGVLLRLPCAACAASLRAASLRHAPRPAVPPLAPRAAQVYKEGDSSKLTQDVGGSGTLTTFTNAVIDNIRSS
jgi:hypothetical protein